MNKIEKLLNEFCPDGVEFKDLGDILDYEQPWKYLVDSTNYDNSYKTPVLTAWQTFILWYTDEEDWIYQASKENPVIIFDDFTTAFKWVDFSFKAKSSAMKMLTSKNIKEYNLRYVFFAMSCLTYSPQDHARQWIQTYSKIQIPIPPIEIQKEIVKILDNFTLLEAELEAELEARKKQYEYYRDDLLSFWDDEVNIFPLHEIIDFKNGLGHEKIIDETWEFVVVNSKFVSTEWKVKKYSIEQLCPVYENDILMVMSDLPNGKALAKCYYVESNNKYSLNQRICALTIKNNKEIDSRFLFYILNRNNQLLKYDNKVDQTNLRKDDILKIKIPVPFKDWEPDLEKQQEIVAILDKFDALVNDISVWLPAELKARRQQYEYYRNKLLDFKVLEK